MTNAQAEHILRQLTMRSIKLSDLRESEQEEFVNRVALQFDQAAVLCTALVREARESGEALEAVMGLLIKSMCLLARKMGWNRDTLAESIASVHVVTSLLSDDAILDLPE